MTISIRWTRYSLLVVVAVFAFSHALAKAQAPGAPQPQPEVAAAGPEAAAPVDETFILRTYEVGDLVINVRDYPYSDVLQAAPATSGGGLGGGGGGFGGGGGMGGGGGGGGFFSVPGEKAQDGNLQSTGVVGTNALLCQFGGGGRPGRGPAGGGAGGGMVAETAPLSTGTMVTINDLVRVLVGTVASETWEMNGGQGKIQPLGTALVIWQTRDVQDLIQGLLRQIRETAGHRNTLTIDARWLTLSSDEFESLFGNDSASPPVADRKALAAFTRRAGSIRGVTNCFSGQLVYLVSGVRRNIVSGYIPVVGSTESGKGAGSLVSLTGRPRIQFVADGATLKSREPSVGYQPIMTMPNFGALLEIRPTSMGGPKSDVVIELKSTLTAPSEVNAAPARGPGAEGLAPAVDRVAIDTQELATTMRVPFGKPVLVGGMTYVSGSAKANEDAKSAERSQLYLLLEIR